MAIGPPIGYLAERPCSAWREGGVVTCSGSGETVRRVSVTSRFWFFRTVGWLCLLVALAAACASSPTMQSPGQSSGSTETPTARLDRIPETGRRLYLSICAYCHGPGGDGFGLNAPNLTTPPRDHTDRTYMDSRTDEQLFAVIKSGGASQGKSVLMPPWGGRLSEREISSLVAYVRSLSRGRPGNITNNQK